MTVVIPNFNGLSHLPGCLEGLSQQTYRGFDITLVDNASQDESLEWVASHHPDVQAIPSSENGGFAKAVNLGIRAARTEYVALLNNDTVVHPRWLESLVTALDERPRYDLAASRMLLYHDRRRLNAAGDVYSLLRLCGRNRGFGGPAGRYSRTERVLGACAGAAMYRRRLFDEVGLFDEDFFLMSEDTDFNLRCLIAGKRCLYVPSALVMHKFRASIDRAPAWEMTRLAIRNEAMVVSKDMPSFVLALAPLLWIYRHFRQTLPLRPSKWHLIPMLLRRASARLAAEREGLRIGWGKRERVWRLQTVGWWEILRWLTRGSGPA